MAKKQKDKKTGKETEKETRKARDRCTEPWGADPRYPYEAVPGHNVSPARYCFQRKMWELFNRGILKPQDRLVLDFGCGPGNYRIMFTGRAYVGFDILPPERYSWQQEGTQFLVADGRKTPFKDSVFDFVFSNAVLEHIEENVAAAKETGRVLKKGKYCVVIVPSRMSVIYDELPFIPLKLLRIMEGHADHYYSKKELVNLLRKGGLKTVKMDLSMGFFSTLLKTFYVWTRFPSYLFYNAMYKWSGRFGHKRDLYSDTQTKTAKNREELFRIQRKEYRKIGLLHRIYRKTLELCYFLDDKIKIPWGGEWLVIARKI